MDELTVKMTAIADEIRELNGGTEKLGLDTMAANVREGNDEIALQKELIERAIEELKGKADPELYNKGHAEGYKEGYNDGEASADSVIDKTVVNFVNHRVTHLGGRVFFATSNLTAVHCQKVRTVGDFCFSSCPALETVRLPACTRFATNSLQYCSKLTALILESNAVCSLFGSNVLQGTPIASGTGFVYVPDALVDSYKTATNWSAYASQIKPISELEV